MQVVVSTNQNMISRLTLTNGTAGLCTYSCCALQPQSCPSVIFLHDELEVGGCSVEAGCEALVLGEPVLDGPEEELGLHQLGLDQRVGGGLSLVLVRELRRLLPGAGVVDLKYSLVSNADQITAPSLSSSSSPCSCSLSRRVPLEG